MTLRIATTALENVNEPDVKKLLPNPDAELWDSDQAFCPHCGVVANIGYTLAGPKMCGTCNTVFFLRLETGCFLVTSTKEVISPCPR